MICSPAISSSLVLSPPCFWDGVVRGRDGVNESPSPDWENILLWQLGEKKCCSLHVSNLEQVSKRLPLPVLVSGWYLDSTWDMLYLFRKRKKNRLQQFEEEML